MRRNEARRIAANIAKLPAAMRETYSRKDQTEVLDADMTPADIIDTLKRLKFEDYLIGVDAVMRGFLVSAVSAMRRK